MLPLDDSICLSGSQGLDYTGQVVVVKADLLRWEYATPDYQLCYATGGNGCNPKARGTTVFCTELYSGDHTTWKRYDILGVANPQQLPDWARERLEAVKRLEARIQPKRRETGNEMDR